MLRSADTETRVVGALTKFAGDLDGPTMRMPPFVSQVTDGQNQRFVGARLLHWWHGFCD